MDFSKISNKNNLYGNIKVFNKNDILIFKANTKKINWYLKKNLIDIIEKDLDDNIISVKLNFNNRSNNSYRDEYFLSDKKNICVKTCL